MSAEGGGALFAAAAISQISVSGISKNEKARQWTPVLQAGLAGGIVIDEPMVSY
jgi:hypothetical protein